ncbi:MAG: hypothetical protein JNK82_04790 [Myxococcaceae bacterium]|nr:hypothetical protein [Myxococcaceae bacterium]
MRRWLALTFAALVSPAWAGDEDYARAQLGRFFASQPESRAVEVAEPAPPPEVTKLSVAAGVGVSDVSTLIAAPALSVSGAVTVWSTRPNRHVTLLLEPRLGVVWGMPLQHVTADLTTRLGTNLYFTDWLGAQLRAGLGPIGRVGATSPIAAGVSGGLAVSGEAALTLRTFAADERLRLKAGCTVTAHQFFISTTEATTSGVSVVGSISFESWL